MRVADLRSKVSGRTGSGGIALQIGPSRDSRAADLTGPTGAPQIGIARPPLAGRSLATIGNNPRAGVTVVQQDATRRGIVRVLPVARHLMATATMVSGAGTSTQIPTARAGPGLRNFEPEEAVSRMISAICGNGILPSFISGRACILVRFVC